MPMSVPPVLCPSLAACVLALGIVVPGAGSGAGAALAQSRLTAQGLTATVTEPGRITVAWRPAVDPHHYWCAAAELATAQGMAQTARLARLDVPARFTDAVFSTDPADQTDEGADRLGRSATGLYTFPRGNSLTIGMAASFCALDHIMLADD